MRVSCPSIVVVLLALALCATPASAAAACPSASAKPSDAARERLVRATLCLVNDQRDRRGLAPLRLNARLGKAAQTHSRDMADQDYFDHTSPTGTTFVDRIRRTGYLEGARSWTVAENIAWGAGERSSPDGTVDAWMRSAGHRANILNPSFREIGIGIADDAPVPDADGGTYTTNFGKRS